MQFLESERQWLLLHPWLLSFPLVQSPEHPGREGRERGRDEERRREKGGRRKWSLTVSSRLFSAARVLV